MDGWAYEWLPKAAVYVLALSAVGLATVGRLADLAARGSRLDAAPLQRTLRRAALAAAVLLVAALAARAVAHTAAAFGAADAWSWESLRTITIESRWGAGWRMQVYAALAVFAAALPRRGARPVQTAAVLALCAALPLLGHAAGSSVRYLIHVGHVAAGGIWIGSLGVLTAIRFAAPPPAADATADADTPAAALLPRFSPLALAGAAIVGATGLMLAALYLGSVSGLASFYGAVLAIKLAGVAGIAGCGWLNWRRVRAGRLPLASLMLAETACALLVLAVTGVLTEVEHP